MFSQDVGYAALAIVVIGLILLVLCGWGLSLLIKGVPLLGSLLGFALIVVVGGTAVYRIVRDHYAVRNAAVACAKQSKIDRVPTQKFAAEGLVLGVPDGGDMAFIQRFSDELFSA